MSDERDWNDLSEEDPGGSVPDPGMDADESRLSPRYAHYQVHREPDTNFIPEYKAPQKAAPKKGGFGRKFASAVALAVVFGLVAGVVFQGVNYASERLLGTGREAQANIGTTAVLNSSRPVQDAGAEGADVQAGTVAQVAQAAMPAVVAITSVSIQEIPSFFGYVYGVREYPSTGSGSGIIVGDNDEELFIATNNHVVEGASTLSVCFIGDDVLGAEQETIDLASGSGDINVEDAVSARTKGTDSENDLAIVSVKKSDIPQDTLDEIKIAQIGSSDDLVVGEQVVAIGNALGYGQSVTSGWISALDRCVAMQDGTSADLIQTDAAINPGNSGGALLNMNGELVGINSAKYASSAVEGMGYAIPISKAEPILQELMNREVREKVSSDEAAYLGVQVTDLSTEAILMYDMPSGAFVYDVTQGEAADDAGICEGDIIMEMDGQEVDGKDDFAELLEYYAAGETVELEVARIDRGRYRKCELQVTLGARPQA